MAGIPTVLITFEDQEDMVKQTALASGVPHERFVFASREVPGPAGADAIFEPLIEALVRSLNEEEIGRAHV